MRHTRRDSTKRAPAVTLKEMVMRFSDRSVHCACRAMSPRPAQSVVSKATRGRRSEAKRSTHTAQCVVECALGRRRGAGTQVRLNFYGLPREHLNALHVGRIT